MRRKAKRGLISAEQSPHAVVQHLAVDDFDELAARKRETRARAEALGHALGYWHRRPNDPYGRWNAFCLTCNRAAVVAVEASDLCAELVYGHALTQSCRRSEGGDMQKEWDELKARGPIEFPVPAFVQSAAYVVEQKVIDAGCAPIVVSVQSPTKTTNFQEVRKMTLTLKGLSKNGENAFYAGARVALRIRVGAFPDKVAPSTIEVADGVFAPGKQPKVKLTAEERKALRAAKPKPTLAERAATAQARADKLAAKAAAETNEL